MNTITIDSKKYVKATDIARELGYTADYVGQLCRARKVDAQLVGRSWYVSEDSIREHKQSRYRSTKKASKETIAQSLEARDADSKNSPSTPLIAHKDNTRLSGEKLYTPAPSSKESYYFTDEAPLSPEGASKIKNGRLPVSFDDAHKVEITSNSDKYDFNLADNPELRFSGSLSISEVEDQPSTTKESGNIPMEKQEADNEGSVVPINRNVTAHSKKTKVSEITSNIGVKHLRSDAKKRKRKLPVEHNTTGVLGMQRRRISDRNPLGGTLKVAVPSDNSFLSSFGIYSIFMSILVSSTIAIFLLGLEATVSIEGSTLVTSYAFEFNTLLNAVSFAR
jgi:hypothetical protein